MNTPAAPAKFVDFELAEKAERAMRRAVRKLYEELARTNETVSLWRNGRVVTVPARDLLANKDDRNGGA